MTYTSPTEDFAHPSDIWRKNIDLNQAPEQLAIEARLAADGWGVDEPDQLFFNYRVMSVVMAHNVLVDEVHNGNIEEIGNPAGYFIGCIRRIEKSLGRGRPWEK